MTVEACRLPVWLFAVTNEGKRCKGAQRLLTGAEWTKLWPTEWGTHDMQAC